MLDLNPSPVRVPTEAAHKLPRTVLLAVLVVFILFGLFGRDLWSAEESRTLGEVLSLASGDVVSMLFPFASGEVITSHGPLTGWIGALVVRLLSPVIDPLNALRLTSLMWFALTTASIWYSTWFLARRREAQPVVQPFGREAPYRDYGRLVADTATLFFVSLFGLVIRSHEPTYQTAELALSALAYFGCTWALTRPYWGAALSGAACGLLMLASNLLAGLTVLAGSLFAHVLVHGIGRLDRKLLTTAVTALAVFSVWPAAAYLAAGEVAGDYFSLWAESQAGLFGLIAFNEVVWFIKHFIWYLCPAWPFALWALWVWRKTLTITQIAMPTAFCAAWIAGFLISEDIGAEALLCVIIAPVCTLAAFGLMSTGRNGKSMLECFCVAVFTMALAGVWVYWAAWTLEFPVKMHYSILRLTAADAGAAAKAHWAGVTLAAAALVFWLVLCVRRLQKRPTVFWNGPWLSASGLTVLWITVLCLFQPVIDSNRTYRYVARDMISVLESMHYVPGVDCVRTFGLGLSERTALFWHSGARLSASPAESCRFYIESTDLRTPAVRPGMVLESYRPRSRVRFRVGRMAPDIE